MDIKDLLIKYLDGELSISEKDEVARILERDPEAKKLLDGITVKRQILLEGLEQLNPAGNKEIPDWNITNSGETSRRKLLHAAFRWAAILILPLAIFFFAREMVNKGKTKITDPTISENGQNTTTDLEISHVTQKADFNYAVSANRCWTEKQMVSTEFNTNLY